jgi:hypothetical protein
MTEYELRKCVRCEVHYIEDCPYAGVDVTGKPEVPEGCWKPDLIKMTRKPHNETITE